jgi:2-succinyl-5-enolpyruvyl-6-hydroxy-3-cyclohexene-1-carboxylate synthase
MKITDAPNLNHLWARLLIEELVRQGVCGFCLSPGSRSTPLAMAIAAHPNAAHRLHFDERGAAFYALGWAKAAGTPAALVCTSGTAVANYWPAVAEAASARVPLIVLTADRPPELLHCGANQAIDQTGIFGNYVRWSFTLPCPNPDVSPAMVLTTAAQAVYRAQRAPAGPVHLNCMFREPLEPCPSGDATCAGYLEPIAAWSDSETPFTQWNHPGIILTTPQRLAVINRISDIERGVLVVGELRRENEIRAVDRLAEALGWPVFADITSGLRLGMSNRYLVPYYDQMLLSTRFSEGCAPDFVLHLGGAVTSKRLLQHLDRLRPEYMLAADHPLRHDPVHLVNHRFEVDLAEFCTWLAPSVRDRGMKPWFLESAAYAQDAGAIIDSWLAEDDALNEIFVARALSRTRPSAVPLFLGNSMPIRDMDMYGDPAGAWGPVAANRGASGIDGNIATAAGYARALRRPVVAVIGDLAALHDLNSLALLRGDAAPVVLVILNNNGGGIFSFLPVAEYPEAFETYFGTPHGLSFEAAARMFELPYRRPETRSAFLSACAEALDGGQSAVIEVVTDRAVNVAQHRGLQQRIAEAVDRMLP